jgi:hypothetical protein
MAGLGNDPVQVYRTGLPLHWEFLRLWTGFELPSSCPVLPGYAPNRNRNILDFMRWPQIDLGAQDLNDIHRPKSVQTNSLDINLAHAAIQIRPVPFCYLLRVIARPSCAFWRSRCLPWIVQIFVPPAHRGWCLVQAPRWGVSRSGSAVLGGLKSV